MKARTTAGACALIAAAASAGAVAEPGGANTLDARIIRDCGAHRGALGHAYPLAGLRATYRRMRLAGFQYQNCGEAVASQIAGAARPRAASVAALIKDCVEHGGRLTRSYTTARLRGAFATLPATVRDETRCPVGIASQANARPGSLKLKPGLAPQTHRPNLDVADTIARIAPNFAVFQQPAEPSDAVPPGVASWAEATNEHSQDRPWAVTADARAIGTDAGRMYALPGAGELCAALVIAGEGVAGACAAVGDPDRLAVLAVTLVPGGVAVWGAVGSGDREVRLLTHDGRWRPATAARNGVYDVFAKVPRLLTYRDSTGVTHYVDWTMTVCLPGQPCPTSARAAGS